MKRQILFRAKRIDNGEWVEGDLHVIDCKHPHIHCNGISYRIDVNTVGQFTGLTDANEVNIFEDDLLQNNKEIIFKVKWHGALYGFSGYVKKWDSSYSAANFKEFLIIGNIYDNPELL